MYIMSINIHKGKLDFHTSMPSNYYYVSIIYFYFCVFLGGGDIDCIQLMERFCLEGYDRLYRYNFCILAVLLLAT